MDDLLSELLGALLEILLDSLLELLFELAAETVVRLFNRESESGREFTANGLAFAGGVAGLLAAWLFPHRLIAGRVVLPGISLFLAPLATGLAMWRLGKQLRRRGQSPSNLATFRGGALFAFTMALVRWLLVGLPH